MDSVAHSPTEQEVTAAIAEIMALFAARQGVTASNTPAQVRGKFSVGATLAISLTYDICTDAPGDGINWIASASYNGVELFVHRDPEDETPHAAYEDDALPLMPLFLVGIRDLVTGSAVLGVAEPLTTDDILKQTQIALAAVGPRVDEIQAAPCTHLLATVYEQLQDAITNLLDITAHVLRESWAVRGHTVHAMAVSELMQIVERVDLILAKSAAVPTLSPATH